MLKKLNPINPFLSIIKNWYLIKQLSKRLFEMKYRGSFLGLLWSIISPILMLIIYTFVFSEVFKIRWGTEETNKFAFAIIMYCGMGVFSIFSESLNGSTSIIGSHVNYVKKIVFPLEIMPVVQVNLAFLFGIISLIIILFGSIIINGTFQWTSLYLPLILIPLYFSTCGFAYIISSLSVYFKDMAHFTTLTLQVLFFMTPIFYPISAVPEKFQFLLLLNPLSIIIEEVRNIMIYGNAPDLILLLKHTVISYIIFYLGYLWFMKTKKGFADVL